MLRSTSARASSLVDKPTNRKAAAAILRDVENMAEREKRNRQFLEREIGIMKQRYVLDLNAKKFLLDIQGCTLQGDHIAVMALQDEWADLLSHWK